MLTGQPCLLQQIYFFSNVAFCIASRNVRWNTTIVWKKKQAQITEGKEFMYFFLELLLHFQN